MGFCAYEAVTEKILALLDKGVAPWRAGWRSKSGGCPFPTSLGSGKRYRGVNVFILWAAALEKGYEATEWVTYRQAAALGGHVRKGEKSETVVFWKRLPITDKATGERKIIPFLRTFNVFNLEQCEGLSAANPALPFEPLAFSPIESATRIAEGYAAAGGPKVEHKGGRAVYNRAGDVVTMPPPERFISVPEYYGTLFHELAHSTGHESRLRREKGGGFGSGSYSREELVAELAACFLCAEAGIDAPTIENSAAYLAGWCKVLREDKKAIVVAAGAAQRAAGWILGERYGADAGAAGESSDSTEETAAA